MLYFGWAENHGHGLWDRSGLRAPRTACPLRAEHLDTVFCPQDPLEREGIVQLQLVHGWTIMAFWDRSGDKRHKSNSAFLAWGSRCFNEMVEQAKEEFPKVFERFTFELKMGSWKKEK